MIEQLHKMVNGEKVLLSLKETQELQREWDENAKSKAAIEYATLRQKEYPSIPEQLDMLYNDMKGGTSAWVDLITKIKEKYPKPQ
jgi:hypothetical protein